MACACGNVGFHCPSRLIFRQKMPGALYSNNPFMPRTSATRSILPSHTPSRGGKPHTIRIIGGEWKRTPLPVLDLDGLRPTPDRVRETLFNWLGQDLSGQRCLDMFAGSGALGFEAASRGAAHVVMIEKDRRVFQALRHNAAALGCEAHLE